METHKEARKLKVIEGYRQPGSKTFDQSAHSIKVDPPKKEEFSNDQSCYYHCTES